MLFIKTFIIININFLLLYFSGIIFTKLAKIKNYSYSIFFSISLVSILISLLYFHFDINFSFIKIAIIFFLIILSLLSIRLLNKKILKFILLDYILFILPVIFFSFLISYYNFQYYIFRGNHYDAINYSSMSLAFLSHTFSELKEIFNNQENIYTLDNIYYIKAAILTDHRVIAPLFFSLNYDFDSADIFYMNFLNKLFFLSLSPIAVNIFLRKLKIADNKNSYYLAAGSSFCFWPIYIFEIDAFSQLMALPFSILTLYLIFYISKSFLGLAQIKLFYFLFIISTFFCIYPEQGSVFLLFGVIYFLVKNFSYLNKKNFIKKIIFSTIFSILIVLSHENIISFLSFQISAYTITQFDWWKYFGAFIIGSENLVLDSNFVTNFKNFLINNKLNDIEKFYYLHKALIENNFDFYYLNILPSFFGLYYLSTGKILSNLDYVFVIMTLFLNLLLLRILILNLKQIFIRKNIEEINYIKHILIYLVVFSLFLIFTLSFWQLIKLYMYFALIILVLILINFSKISENNKPNKLILILLIIFPIYKFTEFNHGINKYDSFPSVLRKDLKIKIDWELYKNQILKCNYQYDQNLNENLDKDLRENVIYIRSILISSNKLKYIKSENPCKKK